MSSAVPKTPSLLTDVPQLHDRPDEIRRLGDAEAYYTAFTNGSAANRLSFKGLG
jgi:hypothetical protein